MKNNLHFSFVHRTFVVMNAKQKRRAVYLYQFATYTPQLKRVKRNEDGTYELAGVEYPYRTKPFDLRWLEAFHWDTAFKPEE